MAPKAKAVSIEPAGATIRYGRVVASYACDGAASRGRFIAEAACPTRSPFQRDRDRIVHSTAFRRLTHKTQVFIAHEADHYRTRLTHTLEVAQVARAMARQLCLDEDLAEAIALAHDLGHPPFGHAGERALDNHTARFGGFDHNAQSLRVVTELEHKYAGFDGLNLSWETLEGLVKHNGPLLKAADAATEALPWAIAEFNKRLDLELADHASAEAQVAALADEIAYSNHDLDDAFRAELITVDMLRDVPLTEELLNDVSVTYGDLSGARMIYEVNRRLITAMISDAVCEARRRLGVHEVRKADDIRHAGEPIIAFSKSMQERVEELGRFLFEAVYRHERVMRVMRNAEQVVGELFEHYLADRKSLPGAWAEPSVQCDDVVAVRHITDFVAGMTDRYALQEHRRLFDATPDLR